MNHRSCERYCYHFRRLSLGLAALIADQWLFTIFSAIFQLELFGLENRSFLPRTSGSMEGLTRVYSNQSSRQVLAYRSYLLIARWLL